jgi:hypothetical protein
VMDSECKKRDSGIRRSRHWYDWIIDVTVMLYYLWQRVAFVDYLLIKSTNSFEKSELFLWAAVAKKCLLYYA